jgi:signal transduction histidine kinase
METQMSADVMAIQAIGAVPTILDAVAAITGLRFVCVAHVTENSWTTCAVLDQLDFGLKPGDELDISTTLCEEVRDTRKAIIINHVSCDEKYRDHHTPKMYGFESYISIPIIRPDGEYFGTLCGLDPLPQDLTNTATIASMTVFAQLISLQLVSESQLKEATSALMRERESAELREQFIAVLGHDLRNPLNAISAGAQMLSRMNGVPPKANSIIHLIESSAQRINVLVDDVVDFTRGRMGGGIGVQLERDDTISSMLEQVVSELKSSHPDRKINSLISSDLTLICDRGRVGQLLSNLLKNALLHGDPNKPVNVTAQSEDGLFKLTVSNGGVMIPPYVIEQLFKPFWRVSPNSPRDGLGLGLFIVSEIARSHGGRISVFSSPEETSFVFTMKSADFIERRKFAQTFHNLKERRLNV